MSRQEQHRLQLERLHDLTDLLRRGQRVTARGLAQKWSCSTKTIYRDIEYLRDRQHAPIEFDQQRGSYVLENPGWQLEQLDLTEGELLELALAQRVAEQYEGTSLGETLQGLFDKIRRALPTDTRIDPVEVRSEISFYGQPARPINRRIWKTLARAVRECRVVKATYWSRNQEKEQQPTLEPLHLANLEGDWYLAARWRPHEEPAILAVSRFRGARLQREVFERGNFVAEDFFANRFGRFVAKHGDELTATVQFDADAGLDVLEREWHPRQEIKEHRDGSVTLTLPFPTEYLAVRWTLQWGRLARVRAPRSLARAVKRMKG